MAANKSRGLGKGLEALFTDIKINKDDDTDIMYIDINKISPNQNQPRKIFKSDKIDELSDSIKIHGVIQPILVKSTDVGYEIIAGERRWRAARKAALKEMPCIIKNIDEKHHMLVSIIENLQREDLNPLEESKAFEYMIKSYGMRQEDVSKNVGKSRPYITNSLRLLKLSEDIQGMILENKISSGHARALINIEDKDVQRVLASEIVEKGLSVRQIEMAASNKKQTKIRPKKRKIQDPEIFSIEDDLKRILGTKVTINHGGKKGKIEIEYYSQDELERLIEMIKSVEE